MWLLLPVLQLLLHSYYLFIRSFILSSICQMAANINTVLLSIVCCYLSTTTIIIILLVLLSSSLLFVYIVIIFVAKITRLIRKMSKFIWAKILKNIGPASSEYWHGVTLYTVFSKKTGPFVISSHVYIDKDKLHEMPKCTQEVLHVVNNFFSIW